MRLNVSFSDVLYDRELSIIIATAIGDAPDHRELIARVDAQISGRTGGAPRDGGWPFRPRKHYLDQVIGFTSHPAFSGCAL